MGKRIQYTKITPLPSNVPRQLAIELLHSHEEVIALNPLVTGSKKIEAPRDSPNDEYFSTWYEISEIITWGFGMKKKINFKGVFHDLPYGMQSHVYAPMGVDLRNKYRIGGNQPGEPRETRELGVDTPLDGLYLREDVEIVCNLALASFVKKETKEATGKMIERLARKAELLDEGRLHAMFADGKLKTSKPTFSDGSDGSFGGSVAGGSVGGGSSPPLSPTLSTTSGFASPRLDKRGFGNYHDVARSASQHRSSQYVPGYQQQGYNGPDFGRAGSSMTAINELPGDMYQQPQNVPDPLKPQGMSFRSELPGDTSFSTSAGTPSPQPSPQVPSQEPQPSPRHNSQELKPPTQQYQAYLPPTQQHPSQRHSYYSEHSSTIPTPELQQRLPSFSGPNWPLSNNNSSNQLSPNTARYSAEQAQPPMNIMPDHQRFSQMSVQSGPTVNVKCPVCSLFEGDEAAVSHHVSKAHFS